MRPDCAYWALATTRAGYRAELAGLSTVADWEAEARRLFGLEAAQVTLLEDRARGTARIALHETGQLRAALFVAPEPVAVMRDYLATTPGSEAPQILTGRTPADIPDPGPTLCACFGVGVNTIVGNRDARPDGCGGGRGRPRRGHELWRLQARDCRRARRDTGQGGRRMTLADHVRTLGRGPGRSRSLTGDEAHEAMRIMLSGDAAPEATGALLMLMRMKGETADEIAGFASAARDSLPPMPQVDLDWPSYAAGRTRGLPWFLLSARLVAQTGHRVLLHGWNGPDAAVRTALPEAGISRRPQRRGRRACP